jgi:Holliday junction resolvase
VNVAGRFFLPPRKLASILRNHGATVLRAPASVVARVASEFPER